MNKMNKKGFTLIEMLVVIAIIAVLVSIIIPTVTSATDKAAAATNAANLRSIKAEIVTAVLTNDTANYAITYAENGNVSGVTTTKTLPAAKKCKDLKDTASIYVAVNSNNNEVSVYFSNDGSTLYSIQNFADFAEGKDLSATTGVSATALKKSN